MDSTTIIFKNGQGPLGPEFKIQYKNSILNVEVDASNLVTRVVCLNIGIANYLRKIYRGDYIF